MESLEKIGKFVPLFTALILISSGLEQLIYYLNFNIEIFRFIDLSDLTKEFLANSIKILGFTLSMYTYLKLVHWFNEKQGYKPKRRKIRTMYYFLIIYFSIFSWSIFKFYYSTFIWYSAIIMVYITLCNILRTKTLRYRRLYKLRKQLKEFRATPVRINNFIFLFLTFNLFTLSITIMNVQDLKEEFKSRITSVTLKNREVPAYAKEFFIGKSNSYIFFFNDSSRESKIIPIEDVLEIKQNSLGTKEPSFTGFFHTITFNYFKK